MLMRTVVALASVLAFGTSNGIIATRTLSDIRNQPFCRRHMVAQRSCCIRPPTLHVIRRTGRRARSPAISRSGSTETPVRWIWVSEDIGRVTDVRRASP